MSPEPPGELFPFNSELAVWTPEGSVSPEPPGELFPFNSELAVWTPEGSVSSGSI